MYFTSFAYIIFLPSAYLAFYFCRDRYRWLVLLGASAIFYGALKVPYLLAVLALVTAATYFFGIGIGQCRKEGTRKILLWGGICVNLLILAVMKYLPFPAQGAHVLPRSALPAGGLVVTFLASGIWHGASWGFVVWGLLHGLYLTCSAYYRSVQKKIHKAFGVEKAWLVSVWQTLVTFHWSASPGYSLGLIR